MENPSWGPHNPNACPQLSSYMTSAFRANPEGSARPRKRTYNPLYQRKSTEEQERKRQVYLTKVREDGNERRWESRSEQVKHRILSCYHGDRVR